MTEQPAVLPTIAGNVPDPDADTLDNLIEQSATPPTPDEQPTAPAPALVKPERQTRLNTGTVRLFPTWAPLCLLPADLARKSLRIRAYGTGGDTVRFSDDPGKLESLSSAAVVFVGEWASLDAAHTGPVWVYAPDAAVGGVTVSYVAVTA